MAPKKAPEPVPSKEAPPEEPPPPEEVTEKRTGNFILPNGSTYVGEYNYTKLTRPPAAAEVQGTAYEPLAQSERLEIHGRGKLLFGPELFDGEWRHGNMVRGKHVFPSGAVYDGFFMNNKFHGQGKYSWADGREYDGFFAEGQMHGSGRYSFFTGGEKEFAGVSVRGKFKSGHAEQAAMRAEFAETYGAPMLASAKAALAKGPDAYPELLVAPMLERDWLAGRSMDQVADRSQSPDQLAEDETTEELEARVQEARTAFPEVMQLLPGPFPTAEAFPLLQALVDGLEVKEGEEAPATALTLVVDPLPAVRRPQLQYLGQCVELAGAAGSAVLCNVGVSKGAPGTATDPETVGDYDVEQACWRLVAAVPAAADEGGEF